MRYVTVAECHPWDIDPTISGTNLRGPSRRESRTINEHVIASSWTRFNFLIAQLRLDPPDRRQSCSTHINIRISGHREHSPIQEHIEEGARSLLLKLAEDVFRGNRNTPTIVSYMPLPPQNSSNGACETPAT